MKTITKWLLAGIMAACCCSIANAQISYSNSLVGSTLIYSNAFNGAAVNITNTPPNYINAVFGGSNNAVWYDALGTNDTNALLASGVQMTTSPDSWELPFAPVSNHVYTVTASLTFSGNPADWVGFGFAQRIPINATNGFGRFSDGGTTPPKEGPNGFDWMILTESSGNVQYFAGAGGGTPILSQNSFFTAGVGTHSAEVLLDTTSNKWIIAGFVDGVQAGTNHPYSPNPTIGAVGITQNVFTSGGQADIHWNSFTLSAAQLVIDREPVSAAVSAGAAYTNVVQAAGAPPFFYQWYTNGTPVLNATNSSYIVNPVTPGNNGINYSAVVTNSAFGAVTSTVATLTVFTNPVITTELPISYTNPISLFGGTNSNGTNYLGSTPTFSVSATGGVPLGYQWYTNGVAWSGQTNASVTFTNAQLNSPTNFTVIVTNAYGSITDAVSVAYLPAPTAPYPQAVLALQPAAFWRLNEQPDNSIGDDGTIANDYESGNNGIYTNVVLAQQGYNLAEPGETSVFFGNGGIFNSYAGSIQGLDFATPAGSNGEFSVGACANGEAADAGAPIISQGIYGTSDAFGLGADTNTTERTYWFYVRSASGTVYKADSSVFADDGVWHNLIGVCDGINSNLSLYIDGSLAATAWIPTNAGVYEASAPMAIGAGTSTPGSYNVQFFGNIDDVTAFKSPLSPQEVAGIFGGPISAALVSPLPPTYVAYMTGGTLTIPAAAFGAPPTGYYWTNLTTGGVIASGITNVLRPLNASLIISNAPASLSGDQLELFITNSLGSTNWTVTLFTPPPPVTLGYTNGILYSNIFNGGLWSIGGMPLTAANSLLGGTNAFWTDALGTNDPGIMMASGISTTPSGDSWILPFTPEPGYIYTVTASVTFSGNPGSGDWVGAGFAQRVPTNAAIGYGRFSDGGTTPPQEGPEGYDWAIITENTGNVQDFGGPGGANQLLSQSGFFTAGPGTHTMELVLDTTNAQWSMAAYVDGTQAGANFNYSANPPIGAVGITQDNMANPGAVQWNSFSLTAVAPGGVPPFLLAPLPGSISLTNSTVSISATAFGSAPFGYNWTFNNSTLASGTTNNMAPLSANLSVPSSSLGAGQLELTVTNAFGTNITLVTLVSAINSNPTNIVTTVTNNNLYLTWPVNHIGWQLQAQTNGVSVGISNNWVNVVGSTTTNQVVVPIDPANGTVFYRLLYNP
jgi:hypothetical protein